MSQDKPKSISRKSWLRRLHQLDDTLSIPLFQLSLPLPLEFLLSIPGNLIGPPSIQIVGTLWILALADDNGSISLWRAAILATILLLLVPWWFFLRGHVWILGRIFLSHPTFALSPFIGTLLAFHIALVPANASLCYHFILLYNLSCIIVMFLKHGAQRTRPCVVHHQFCTSKNYQLIPQILAKTANDTSFPSGDAMSATSLAIPLYLGTDYKITSLVLVTLTCIGRIYFLAHHFFDTLAGILIPLGLQVLIQTTPFLPSLGTVGWHHPLQAVGALAIASRMRKNDKK